LISFEPNPPVFELLRNNLARNVHNAAAVNMALSNTNMELPFFIDTSGNLGKSTLNKNVKSEQCQTITVSAVRGDEYLAEVSGIDFIKIDVEGHEGEVIEGLQGIISKSQPLLLIEWNSDDTRHNFNSEKLTNMFNGYSFVALGNNYDRELYKSPRMKIKRKVMKLFKVKKEWAFIAFHRHTNYSNVFLVPPRFRETFKTINGSLPF
jgi:FkbM family methyltransferase